MRLRDAKGYTQLKQEMFPEIAELEQKITKDRQTLGDEVGEERFKRALPTSKAWETINEDTDRMQAKRIWIDQLNRRIAKGTHPCQDFGPRKATLAMLVEIQEFYKQLVIKDNQEN